MSGLVRARGLKLVTAAPVTVVPVRARKSPWIETSPASTLRDTDPSGLVRARGLKLYEAIERLKKEVRARKSPWIETL